MTWDIITGDCLEVLPVLPEAAMVYADPPFLTGQRRVGKAGSFDDRGNLESYLAHHVPRLLAAWERLDARGSMVVHLDWHVAPWVRVNLDELLGIRHFASEIIWRYRRWPTKTPNFQRVHDVLLRYVKTPGSSRWNQLFEPLSASTVETWGDRRQQREGRRSVSTDEPSMGCPMGDVWELPIVAPVARERTGYPTQKPERLLERLLLALTDPGDLVIDPYCGSGTTCAVAARLGRSAIGIDRNPEATAVARKRLDRLTGDKVAEMGTQSRTEVAG